VSEDECRDLLWATTDGILWQRLVSCPRLERWPVRGLARDDVDPHARSSKPRGQGRRRSRGPRCREPSRRPHRGLSEAGSGGSV